jgi:hypothetical protein
MNTAFTVGMWISSRVTLISISLSWPAELGHGLIARPALGVVVLDLGDDVAAPHAALIGGRAFEHVHDGHFAARGGLDGDPEAVVAPFLTLAHLGVGLRVHEARMRIERIEHPGDGAIDQPVGLRLAHVHVLHGFQCRGEDFVLLGYLILGYDGAASQDATQHRAHDHHACERRERPVSGHIGEMYTLTLTPSRPDL